MGPAIAAVAGRRGPDRIRRERNRRDRHCGERSVHTSDTRRVPRYSVNFGEVVDLGGATSAGMVWRAAAAVELGICDAVLAVVPDRRNIPRSATRPTREFAPFGASSNNFGSPQAEFEIPYGNLGQNIPYAQIAQRYAAEFGWDARALAKIAVDQRTNSCAYPDVTRSRYS